jgi:membrane-associated phospholipid phosphatase
MSSRVILLQHYITDVMVSAYLALIEVWLLQWVLNRYAPDFMQEVLD